MRRFGILAGGPEQLVPPLHQFSHLIDEWIGVDRGAFSLIQQGIKPVKAFGDFDSITLEEKEMLQKALPNLNIYPSEKDQTDLELAIEWMITQGITESYVFGVTGGRLDHELAAIHILQEGIKAGVRLVIIDKMNRIEVLGSGSQQISKIKEYPYLSLLSLREKSKGCHLKDLNIPCKVQY